MNELRKEELKAAIAEIGKKQESSLPRPFRAIGSFVMQLRQSVEVPALRQENDYGSRELSAYSGPVTGIDHIVKVVHDHKTGRLPNAEFSLTPDT